jgi:hypothetical protein
VRDYFDRTLQDETQAVADSLRPAPVEAVRARGDQRRRRQAAGVALLTLVLLAGGGIAVRATIGRAPARSPLTRSVTPAVSPSPHVTKPRHGPRPSAATQIPAYLVTAVAGQGSVRATATGRVLAPIARPASVFAFEGVAAAPGDRTFYLAAVAAAPRGYLAGAAAPRGVKIEFFRLTLGANGRPGVPQRLPGPPYLAPLPITSDALTTIPLAISPDGKELAYASGSQFPDTPGSTLPSGTQGIIIQNVSTGARRTWSTWPASHTEISDVSWAAGGRLGFGATVGDAAVSNRAVIRQPGNELNVFMVLNTAAAGSSLISASHLVAYGSAAVSASGAAAQLAGPSAGIISRDGRIVYARIETPQGTSRLVAISVATGQVTRVLLSGPQAADAAVSRGGAGAADPAPMSVDRTSLLFPLSLPHPPVRTSGKPYVIGHLAVADLATGQITQLPFPLYYGPETPFPPVGAAW